MQHNQRLKEQQQQALMQHALLQQQSLYHPGLLAAAPQVLTHLIYKCVIHPYVCQFCGWRDFDSWVSCYLLDLQAFIGKFCGVPPPFCAWDRVIALWVLVICGLSKALALDFLCFE